jgi:nucleobase:cation symporter-1, NCS1 family
VAALVAVVLGVLPTMPGFLASVGLIAGTTPFLRGLYDVAWFVGTGVSALLYCLLMALQPRPLTPQPEAA